MAENSDRLTMAGRLPQVLELLASQTLPKRGQKSPGLLLGGNAHIICCNRPYVDPSCWHAARTLV